MASGTGFGTGAEIRVAATASEFGAVGEAPVPAAAVAAEPPADLRMVAGGRVNMRAGPGTSHDVLGVLSRGEGVEILGLEGGWAQIRSGGREGWMALSLLSEAG